MTMKTVFPPATATALALALALCLAPPASAVDSAASADAPDLAAPRALIKAKDWPAATAALKKLAETNPHADVYSLLGFSLRNAGNIAEAKVYYAKALDFDPDHKGANEYLGELYLKVGDMAKAQQQLAKLQRICPKGCEELDDLRKEIAKSQRAAAN